MKRMIRDDPSVAASPLRRRFALFQLWAHLRPSSPRDPAAAQVPIALMIDRDQTAVEQFLVSFWVNSTVAVFLAVEAPLPFLPSLLLAYPAAALFLQLPVYVAIPLALRKRSTRLVGPLTMGLVACAAVELALRHDASRFAGMLFFALCGLNAIAWLLLRMAGRGPR